jgi:hypothetical protein
MDWTIWTLVGLGIIILLGAGYFFLVWKIEHKEPHLTFRHAATVAKEALLNKDNPPEIFRRMKDKTEVPFDALKENKKKAVLPGTYHFRWPNLQLGYTNKEAGEKIVIEVEGHEEIVSAFYHDGAVNGVKIGNVDLDMEDFEMRHAGTIGDHLRSFVRYYLRFPEGTLEIEKAPEPTFKPVLDLRKGGEIHLHGKPPPEKMPNFKDNEE